MTFLLFGKDDTTAKFREHKSTYTAKKSREMEVETTRKMLNYKILARACLLLVSGSSKAT